MNVEAVELLRELLAEVRALRVDLAERRRSTQTANRPPKPEDREAIQAILPAIARSIDTGVVFTVRDLLCRAGTDKELRAVLQQVFGAVLDRTVARRAGDMLKRNVGVVQCGFRVERTATVREGALWMVQRE